MRIAKSKLTFACRIIAPMLLTIGLFNGSNSLDRAEAAVADRILQLRPDQEAYYLGAYLEYLEDAEKTLTIADASADRLSPQYARGKNRILNLGINSKAYWIRFSIDVRAVGNLERKWLIFLGWPNNIDLATLYIPDPTGDGWFEKAVGRRATDKARYLPGNPAAFINLRQYPQPLTVYLRVESVIGKQIPLQILTRSAYQRQIRQSSVAYGVYYGILLAMVLYNLIWFVSLREAHRLFYLLYLISMGVVFLSINEYLIEIFNITVQGNRLLLFIFLGQVFFWSSLFARSFLLSRKTAPICDRLLLASGGLGMVLTVLIPFVELRVMLIYVFLLTLLAPLIFIAAGYIVWRRGFAPARFYLIAFLLLALGTIYESLVSMGFLPCLTRHASQLSHAVEVILLQLALADRFRTLSREKDRIDQSLLLAREVQQSLLPHQSPRIPGLEIAGKSIYCDETGGDYYDYIINAQGQSSRVGIALGDVSGHGISSALLMATVRSSIRQRTAMPGGIADIISDVNRQLAADVEYSGQFMTLFYLVVDLDKQRMQWVRAGHDPAILYDPGINSLEELAGSGVALGAMDDWRYEAYSRSDLVKGQIILLSTDGIWEARNPQDEMFGKDRILQLLRENATRGANDILNLTLDALNAFLQGAKLEDDITLVVVKIE